jgi:hypothetical protein
VSKLNLARGLSLDPDYVGGGTFALLAKKGWGKTYAMRVMAEEFARCNVPFVCLDPMDAFWGLRAGKDALEVPIFGGPHGDVALESTAGRLMADLVVDEHLSMILSIAHFGSRAQERRFAMDFFDQLYRRNSDLVHLLVDEADLFAPQKPQQGDQPLLGVTENIVRRGRNKGIGITLGTQRPAVLNKDVLTQVDGLIVGRMLGPQDRNAIDGWVGEHGDHSQGGQIKNMLPDMGTGQAWVWIPELKVLKEVKIRAARTFDSSPTRKRSSRDRQLTLADVDLSGIGEKIAATVERSKASDPKELRKKVAQLEKQLAERPAAEPAEPVEIKVPVIDDDIAAKIAACVPIGEQLAKAIAEAYMGINSALERVAELLAADPVGFPTVDRPPTLPAPAHRASPKGAPRSPTSPAPAAPVDSDVTLKAGARRMLEALAQLHPNPLTRSQLGTLADVTPGGTFSSYLSTLNRAGLIEEMTDKRVGLSSAGVELVGDRLGAGAPSPAELQVMWERKLKAGARRMLDHLMGVYPEGLDRAALGERADVTPGGTFSSYLSSLRRNNLAEERSGVLYAGEALFLGGS